MRRRSIYILVAFVLVLLLAGYWFFLLSPLRADIADTEQTINEERQALTTARTKLAQLEDIKKRATENRGRLLELGKMLPPEPQVPSLLLEVQDLAVESGINFMSMSPNVGSPQGPVTQTQLSLQCDGTFFDVIDFIYRAEQLAGVPGRILMVENLALSGKELTATPPELNANMTLVAYHRAGANGGE